MTAPLPIQLTSNCLGKQWKTVLAALPPCLHVRDLGEASGSRPAQLWPLWWLGERTSKWKTYLSLSLCLSNKSLKKCIWRDITAEIRFPFANSNAHNIWGWAMMKPGAISSIFVYCAHGKDTNAWWWGGIIYCLPGAVAGTCMGRK